MPIANRRSVHLENDHLRLTLLPGGGHIAGLTLKSNGVNPLWEPPWDSIEPADYDPAKHPEFGSGPEAHLLAGIAGHNLCFDFFGGPSDEEAAAGLTVHGEASLVTWDVSASEGELRATAELPGAGMKLHRTLRIRPGAQAVVVNETVENLRNSDRAVGWTEHATLGPPFLAMGKTVFHAPAGSSKVLDMEFADGHDRFEIGAEFQWPTAPLAKGGFADMRLTVDTAVSGAFTSHLMTPAREQAYFTAYNPQVKTLFGYVWKRSDFPWLGIWEENHCRQHPPWNGRTFTRGLEFGVSPIPESRRQMIERGGLFGESGYRWIPARSKVSVEYCLFIAECDRAVEAVEWKESVIRGPGGFEIPA